MLVATAGAARAGAPTTLIATSEDMGLHVMHGLHGMGVAIPDETSVISREAAGLSESLIPPHTTIWQNEAAIVIGALDLVVSDEPPGPASRGPAPYELIDRGLVAGVRGCVVGAAWSGLRGRGWLGRSIHVATCKVCVIAFALALRRPAA